MFVRIFLIVLCLLITVSACSPNEIQTPAHTNLAEVSYPAAAEPLSRSDITFDIVSSQRSALKRSAKLYRAEPLPVNAESEKQILDVFGLSGCSGETDAVTQAVTYRLDNKRVEIYPDGTFIFEAVYDTDRKDFPFNMADSDVGKAAEEFLSAHGLLPDGFLLTDRFGEQGVIFEEDGVEQTVVTAKGALFQRKIDGMDVIGQASDVDLIDVDAAISRAKTDASFMTWDPEKMAGNEMKAVINAVRLVYYDDPLDKEATHIQPCYLFEGTVTDELADVSKISIIVPALKEEAYLKFPNGMAISVPKGEEAPDDIDATETPTEIVENDPSVQEREENSDDNSPADRPIDIFSAQDFLFFSHSSEETGVYYRMRVIPDAAVGTLEWLT